MSARSSRLILVRSDGCSCVGPIREVLMKAQNRWYEVPERLVLYVCTTGPSDVVCVARSLLPLFVSTVHVTRVSKVEELMALLSQTDSAVSPPPRQTLIVENFSQLVFASATDRKAYERTQTVSREVTRCMLELRRLDNEFTFLLDCETNATQDAAQNATFLGYFCDEMCLV